jgi:hypothetical protein
MWDTELQEIHDYVGTMTANMISERTEKTNGMWVRALQDQYLDTAQRHSPRRGQPPRGGRTRVDQRGRARQRADPDPEPAPRQMARDLDRFDQKKADDMALLPLPGRQRPLAGGSGGVRRPIPAAPRASHEGTAGPPRRRRRGLDGLHRGRPGPHEGFDVNQIILSSPSRRGGVESPDIGRVLAGIETSSLSSAGTGSTREPPGSRLRRTGSPASSCVPTC